jgi:hypothetical protein
LRAWERHRYTCDISANLNETHGLDGHTGPYCKHTGVSATIPPHRHMVVTQGRTTLPLPCPGTSPAPPTPCRAWGRTPARTRCSGRTRGVRSCTQRWTRRSRRCTWAGHTGGIANRKRQGTGCIPGVIGASVWAAIKKRRRRTLVHACGSSAVCMVCLCLEARGTQRGSDSSCRQRSL